MTETATSDRQAQLNTLREWLQMAAMVTAAIWGVYEFIWKDVITPSHRPTALDLVASLEQVGERDDHVLVRARLAAHNPTDRRIYVPAYWFIVSGHALELKAGAEIDYRTLLAGLGDETGLVSTYGPERMSAIVAQQRLVTSGTAWWEPQDKTNDEAVFAVPKDRFDYLQLRVVYMHTRDAARLAAPTWSARSSGAWEASFCFASPGGHPCQPFDPGKNKEHAEWQEETAAGYNWHVTTLALQASTEPEESEPMPPEKPGKL